ncbi:hypothetical protein SETIT_9G181900v2 [Setaria italica]|uniref:Uncharacterized protein n=1 Tax=Setaria italica TaxID=4555 RepID=A0A368SI42_SETIT|nr:hypothetical protein SETIT_9G181900v2 [Setaria italica]
MDRAPAKKKEHRQPRDRALGHAGKEGARPRVGGGSVRYPGRSRILDATAARRSYPNSLTNMSGTTATAANSSSLDESKLTMQFCTERKLHCLPGEFELCSCCENQLPDRQRCFLRPEECKANCPYCTPKCA